MTQHPDLAIAVDLAYEFLQLLRQQQAEALEMWLMKALKSSLKPFQTFAQGLLDDYAAVKASMSSRVSNGPVEGLNNRLKMLKRQMYGRAGERITPQALHLSTISASETHQFSSLSLVHQKLGRALDV